MKSTHVLYSDEAYQNERYRSLAAISCSSENSKLFSEEVQQILVSSGVNEFKWKNLSSAKMRFAAEKLILWIINNLSLQMLRVDIVIWDMEDSRHNITNIDNNANLARMNYHLLNNICNYSAIDRW